MAYSGTHETTKFGERDSGNALLVEIASRGSTPVIESIRTGGLQWTVIEESLTDLFSGLEYRVIKDSVNNRSSLAAEIWKIFLIAMALALVLEAALCLPPKTDPEAEQAVI